MSAWLRRLLFLLGCAAIFLLYGGCSLLVGDFSLDDNKEDGSVEQEDSISNQDDAGPSQDDSNDQAGAEETSAMDLYPDWCTILGGMSYNEYCWVLGEEGQGCNDACKSKGLLCDVNKTPTKNCLTEVNDASFLNRIKPDCEFTEPSGACDNVAVPYYVEGYTNCVWYLVEAHCTQRISCGGEGPNFFRLCPCVHETP